MRINIVPVTVDILLFIAAGYLVFDAMEPVRLAGRYCAEEISGSAMLIRAVIAIAFMIFADTVSARTGPWRSRK